MDVRRISFVLVLIIVASNVFCEEWKFEVIRDAAIRHALRHNEVAGVLPAGLKIVTNGAARFESLHVEGKKISRLGFLPPDGFNWVTVSHFIDARDAVPVETIDLFGSDILADYNNILISYTLNIMSRKERETIFLHEAFYRNNPYSIRAWDIIYWYETYHSDQAGFFAHNSMLSFGHDWQLIVNSIERTELGYRVRCRDTVGNLSFNRNEGYIVPTLNWSLTEGMPYFYLLIHIDGEYIDLYINNTENRLGTFVSVSDEFVRQFNNLIRTNTVDLSNIVWPSRADGGMDFSPEVTVIPTQQTVEPPVVTTSENQTDEITDNTENQENAFVQHAETSSIPLWVLIAIVGGIVIVVSVVVLLVVKRKR